MTAHVSAAYTVAKTTLRPDIVLLSETTRHTCYNSLFHRKSALRRKCQNATVNTNTNTNINNNTKFVEAHATSIINPTAIKNTSDRVIP